MQKERIVALMLSFVMLFGLFGCKKQQEQIECGGVTRKDYHMPKTIDSKEITAFSTHFFLYDYATTQGDKYFDFVIAADESGTLIATEKRSGVAFPASEQLLKDLQSVIERNELVKQNGLYEVTAGLPPEYQECPLRVEYASGERLYFAFDNDPYAAWENGVYLAFASFFHENGETRFPLQTEAELRGNES